MVTVAPGERYHRGSLYRAFLGSGNRELWTTPITVPVADLSMLAGGLTPVRLGGGMTTRTLHLDGADGRRYVFRSVDKEPRDLLDDFMGTPLEAILQDQVSSFHPSGAMVVAGLLDAIGVLHPEPQLMVVPDDPRLGEFREEFAGMLVLFEERPDDGPRGSAGFAESPDIEQTEALIEILEDEPESRVAGAELLRSRLVDLLVGDRDRSTNNHLWARIEQPDGSSVWRVIPRDRDQAFVQFDGLLKGLGRIHDNRLVTFDEEYPNVEGLTRNAWDIDRWLLVGLGRAEWDATVRDVQSRLTDDVIDDAVRRLPPEHYAIAGVGLAAALKRRRDDLAGPAEELYRIVFGHAEIHTTDADEEATVERRPDGSMHVVVRAVDPDLGVTYDRTFVPDETAEVRLFMQGGRDLVTVTGRGPGQIRLRAIGGGSADRFVDSSIGGTNDFYDGGNGTELVEGPGTNFHDHGVGRRYSWLDSDRYRDWGVEWRPLPGRSYDGDRGLVLGGSVAIDRFGFDRDPYASHIDLALGWSFGLSTPVLEYRQHFRDAVWGEDLRIDALVSGMEVIGYYGSGNETPEGGPAGTHRVFHTQVRLSPYVVFGDNLRRWVGVGPVVQYMSTDSTDATNFIGATDPYGSGRFWQAGLRAAVSLDGRDRRGMPSSGYFVEGGGAFYPQILDVDRGAFGEAHARLAAYLSPPGGNPTLALRAEGKKLWGTFPFAESAFLGGSSSLRGLREQRYAGDAYLLGSAEVRLHLARLLVLVPSDFGVLALSDVGRVFVQGESSDRWRASWGGGIWFAPLSRGTVLQLSLVRHRARNAFYAGVGFAF